MSIRLQDARAIISATRRYALENSLRPLTVVVLDAGGHVVAAEREDGASIKRFEIAYGKAAGALALGIGSRAIMARAEQQPYFVTSVGAVAGALVPVPGGVLVRHDSGELLGAVGVTGDASDADEAAGLAGIESAGFAGQIE